MATLWLRTGRRASMFEAVSSLNLQDGRAVRRVQAGGVVWTPFDLTSFVNTGSDGAHWVPELSDLFTDDGTTAAGDTDNVKQINDLSSFGRNLTTTDNSTRGTYDAANRRIGLDGTDDFYFHETSIAWPGGPYLAWVSFTTLDSINSNLRALIVLLDGGDFGDNAFIVDGNPDSSIRSFIGSNTSGDTSVFSAGDTINVVYAHDGTDVEFFVNDTLIDTISSNPIIDPYTVVIGARQQSGTSADLNSRLQLYNAGYRIGSWTTAQRDDLIAYLTAQEYGS